MSEPAGDVEAGAAAGGGGIPDIPETKGALKPIDNTTPSERIAMIVGIAGVTFAVGMVATQGIGANQYLLGAILVGVMAPYAYYQQTRLTDIRALQETQQMIEKEVHRLEAENKRLAENIENMADSVDGLEDIEGALEEITKTQGQSVETFEKQVAENQRMLNDCEDTLQMQVLMNLNSVLAKSDSDGDFTVDPDEIDTLVQRMKSIPGVNVNEIKFRAATSGKSMTCVMEIIRNLFADVPENERIFFFENK